MANYKTKFSRGETVYFWNGNDICEAKVCSVALDEDTVGRVSVRYGLCNLNKEIREEEVGATKDELIDEKIAELEKLREEN